MEVNADLLVVGASRLGRNWNASLGTTTERVLQTARTPVLAPHQPFFRAVRRVLLTTDLSETSARMHEHALDVEEFAARRRERAYPVAARLRVGDRPMEINVEADSWNADLLVPGTWGGSDPGRPYLGSVAAATPRDAVRNVLVIPARSVARTSLHCTKLCRRSTMVSES